MGPGNEINVNLRQATPADGEFAYQTKKAAFRVYVEMVWGWDEAEQRELHDRRFSAQDVQVVRAFDADVGILSVVRGPDCLKLNQLYILPTWQNKGIGESCMMRVIRDAAREGLPVRLGVLKVNTRAAAFYSRLGFIKTGESDTHVLMERTRLGDTDDLGK